jgi:hypothetical protein
MQRPQQGRMPPSARPEARIRTKSVPARSQPLRRAASISCSARGVSRIAACQEIWCPRIARIFGIAAFVLSAQVLPIVSLAAGCADLTKEEFARKVPHGVYMLASQDHADPFLLSTEQGLQDPDRVVLKEGQAVFADRYVSGRSFDVYLGFKRLAAIRAVSLNVKPYMVKEPRYLRQYIQYESIIPWNPLHERYRARAEEKERSSLFLVGAPADYHSSKEAHTEALSVTEADKDAIHETVIRDVIPRYVAQHKQKIAAWGVRYVRTVTIREVRDPKADADGYDTLVNALPLDVDGNGRKDVVGIYQVSSEYRDRYGRGHLNEMFVYLLTDTGRLEVIGDIPSLGRAIANYLGQPYRPGIIAYSADYQYPLSIQAAIDFDDDGYQEILLDATYASDRPDDSGGYQSVLRKGCRGWEIMYLRK